MALHCCLCGRLVLTPAVMIGSLPVGPKCARRAGLIEAARRKVGRLLTVPRGRAAPVMPQGTLDLFDEDTHDA